MKKTCSDIFVVVVDSQFHVVVVTALHHKKKKGLASYGIFYNTVTAAKILFWRNRVAYETVKVLR